MQLPRCVPGSVRRGEGLGGQLHAGGVKIGDDHQDGLIGNGLLHVLGGVHEGLGGFGQSCLQSLGIHGAVVSMVVRVRS